MVSVAKAKKIMGKDGANLSDEQVEQLLRDCCVLAEILIDQYQTDKQISVDKRQQNTNIKLRS